MVSVVGVSRDQPDAERRAADHHAASRATSAAPASTTIVDRLKQAVAPIPGMTVYFQPVQDIQISTRASRAQYQYTLVGTDAAEVHRVVRQAGRSSCGTIPRCATSPPRRRTAACACRSRSTARRPAGSASRCRSINDTLNDAFGQRQISTIYGQANQYRVILEADAAVSARSGRAVEALRAGEHVDHRCRRSTRNIAADRRPACRGNAEHAGAAERLRRDRAHHRAARDRAPGAVPVGHHQLQSRARRGAERRGRRDLARPSATIGMPSSVTGSYSGDAAEFAQVARRRAVADPRRRGHDLHRARRAVRELHPSAHDPVDAAVGRRRRAAGADAVRLRPVGDRADRHRAADGHREEERDHDDRLRARSRAQRRACRRATRSCRRACCASARS